MEGRSIEQMAVVSRAVKGELDSYLTRLEAQTKENLSAFYSIRGASTKVVGGTAAKPSVKLTTKEA